MVRDQVLPLAYYSHQLANCAIGEGKLSGKSPADVMGKERNSFRGGCGRFQATTIISKWFDVFLMWGRRLLYPPLASTSTPVCIWDFSAGLASSDHLSSHNAGFAKLVVRRVESARRSCQMKLSIAANVTHCGRLTTTYRSQDGAGTTYWCSRRESNPEPWD